MEEQYRDKDQGNPGFLRAICEILEGKTLGAEVFSYNQLACSLPVWATVHG